jgi:hypothetical protein
MLDTDTLEQRHTLAQAVPVVDVTPHASVIAATSALARGVRNFIDTLDVDQRRVDMSATSLKSRASMPGLGCWMTRPGGG